MAPTPRRTRPAIEDDFQPYCEELYRLVQHAARRFIHDKDMREDVIQYTIERVIHQRRKLYDYSPDPRGCFGYLIRAVIFNYWRLLGKSNRMPLLDRLEDDNGNPIDEIPDETYEPYRILQAELQYKVKLMLKDLAAEVLTEREMDVFQLRLAGRSFKAIAEALGRTPSACRKSWMLITRKLAKAAQQRGLV